ncbi:hypothetical protein FQA39_LY09033 [Lamprigera yunnana]|nr:hypothetical protein FQA39_LY09033 [Lamprigera yunnana]
MRIRGYFVGLLFFVLCFYIFFGTTKEYFFGTTMNNNFTFTIDTEDDCQIAHIGVLCIKNTFNVINFYTMLKSICIYQIVPITLHIVADTYVTNILNTLFESLELKQVTVNIHNVDKLPHLQFTDKSSLELAKLVFPLAVKRTVSKILVIDSDLFFIGNINVLYNYDKITTENELIRWFNVRDVRNDASFKSLYNTVSTLNPNFFFQVNNCPEATNRSIVDSIVVPEKCSIVPEAYGKLKKYPTLLFIREFYHESDQNDVTIVTQMSYDKLSVFELICERWIGPISVAIYVTEEEFPLIIDYIEHSKTLNVRRNIAYHVVFKKGIYQPINKLRNIALENVNTPYVLLNDVDFVPGNNLYNDVEQYISKTKDMNKKALVIPAFEIKDDKMQPPIDVKEWLKMWDKNIISQFQIKEFKVGHAPTNYKKLRTENSSYLIKWYPFYEPYVVVKSTVIRYDNRFVGYAWNKVQHIMELHAAGFDFVVLPNTFLTHKFHNKSADAISFLRSTNYRWCAAKLFNEFINYLNDKYNKSFKGNYFK